MLKKLLWGAGIVTGLGIIGAVASDTPTDNLTNNTNQAVQDTTTTPSSIPVQNTSVTPSSPESVAPVNTAVSKPAPEPEPEPYVPPVTQQESSSAETTPRCHPSYSGCLKADASDYDCSGGSGNGPYYTGRVSVIGPDVFDLDRDNDGVACE